MNIEIRFKRPLEMDETKDKQSKKVKETCICENYKWEGKTHLYCVFCCSYISRGHKECCIKNPRITTPVISTCSCGKYTSEKDKILIPIKTSCIYVDKSDTKLKKLVCKSKNIY